jgi:NAD(P)H-dependent FMN reductase
VNSADKVRHWLVKLNELDYIPCQSCGEAPTPKFCFFDDDLTPLYRELARCDCLLFGSPIYFDAVSAQAKAFIDRCNCIRPYDFDNVNPDHSFIKLLDRKRPGAIVLVGGEKGWFEGARRCIAGYFKWVEVVNEGFLKYTPSTEIAGEAAEDRAILKEADRLGRKLAKDIEKGYG